MKDITNYKTLTVWEGCASVGGKDTDGLKMGELVTINGATYQVDHWGMPTSGYRVYYMKKLGVVNV